MDRPMRTKPAFDIEIGDRIIVNYELVQVVFVYYDIIDFKIKIKYIRTGPYRSGREGELVLNRTQRVQYEK